MQKKNKEKIISLFYPRRCPFCDEAVAPGKYVHDECFGRVERFFGQRCEKCGKETGGPKLCYECENEKHYFECGIGVFPYAGAVRSAVSGLKFHGRREFAAVLSAMVYREVKDKLKYWDIDCIVPVPAHRSRVRKRGYNQAELLSVLIGEMAHIPVRTDIIARKKKTKAMKDLDKDHRLENIKNALEAVGRADGMSILIVDDIYTTGATIDAVSTVLLSVGALKTRFLAVCIGRGFMIQ